MAPSCALLFLPFGLPVSIRCYGRVYLIPRLTLGSGKAVRSKLDCMHEPPVQPDYHVVPVTIILSPTRNRHEKSPVAVAISNWISRSGVVECSTEFLKWWPDCGYTGRTVLVPALRSVKASYLWYLRSVKASYLRKKELVALDSGKRTTVGSGGFFVCRA